MHVFASTGAGDARKLTDREGHYRLRAGDWRIRIQLEADAIRILDVSRRNAPRLLTGGLQNRR
jgi:hypothetical protein